MISSRNLAVGSLVATGLLAATAGAADAFTIDGGVPLPRTPHNAFPNSNLTITNNIGTTGQVIIDENTYGAPDLGAGFFANRSDVQLSSDGGATAHQFMNQEDFSLSLDYKLDAVNNLNRKEAGIAFSHPATGDGLFIAVSDNGEIASFAGFLPFTCNLCGEAGGDYGGGAYTTGDTISVQAIYRHGVGVNVGDDPNTPLVDETSLALKPASMEFIVNGISSGLRYVPNNENGILDGSTVNLFMQSQPLAVNLATEANTATFNNIVSGSLLAGDLNADGFVGIADLNIVLGAWNETQVPNGPTPTFLTNLRADPSNDNFVGIADLNIVLGNWNAGTPPAAGSVIPEPATLSLLSLGGLAMLRRNRVL